MGKKEQKEVARMDEDTASKAAAGDEPVGGSIPSASVMRFEGITSNQLYTAEFFNQVVEESMKHITPPEPTKYKMNMYRPDGAIRGELPKSLVHTMSARWGDIMRIIPSNRWSTLEEIVGLVWDWEKRQYRKAFSRTRKQIEDAVSELAEAGIIDKKP